MKAKIAKLVLALAALASMFLFAVCNSEKIADPGSTNQFLITQQPIDVFDGTGVASHEVYAFETRFASITDLEHNKQYCLAIARPGETEILYGVVVTSDSVGQILNIPILFDGGFDPTTGTFLPPGEYELRVQGHDRSPFVRIVTPLEIVDSMNPGAPSIIPSDASGNYNGGSVLLGEDLFAFGGGLPANTEIRLYVVADQDAYSPGDPLTDLSGGFETITTDADGAFPATLIWSAVSAAAGTAFDLVADIAPFGEYNAGDGVREMSLPGVIAQDAPAATDIITELSYNVNGTIQNLFADDERIAVKVISPQRPLIISGNVAIYLVTHQDVWTAGDPLVGVINSSSHEMPNFELDRPLSAFKALYAIVNEPGFFPPGNYDIVIDVGRNGVYDPGTDIIDGLSQIGLTVAGDVPPIRVYLSTDADFIWPFMPSTRIYAKAVDADDNPIPGAEVAFEIISGPGSLTATTGTTDAHGVASTEFSGGDEGSETIIQITVTVDGETFVDVISIWRKVNLHNQGGGSGG